MTSAQDGQLHETKSTTAPWVRPKPVFNEDTRQLFTQYAGVPEDKIDSHITEYVSPCTTLLILSCLVSSCFESSLQSR